MKTTDCTPPPDLPDVVLVFDPKRGFWLRVANDSGGFDCPHDGYFASLPGAQEVARNLGFEAVAWVDGTGHITPL